MIKLVNIGDIGKDIGKGILGGIRNTVGKINAGVIALAFKVGPKLLTTVAKFAKVGKLGLAAGSMAAYSYLFTWEFAIIIMLSLFVHEYGHIFAMKRCGLKTKGIYFIPFLGAAAVTEETFKSRRDEVYIAIMGPIFGFTLAGLTLIVYMVTQNALFAATAGWMAMVNLFNLLPINPLDGGRIMKSIAFSINSNWGNIFLAIGISLSLILTFYFGIVLFSILLIIGTLEFIYEYKMRNANSVIKECVKYLDGFFIDYDSDCGSTFDKSVNNVKKILLDENLDSETRINKIISIGEKFQDENSDIDFGTRGLSHAISPVLRKFDNIPKMNIKGIIVSVVVYVGVIAVLWALITYTSHIPEVDIVRQFFMS